MTSTLRIGRPLRAPAWALAAFLASTTALPVAAEPPPSADVYMTELQGSMDLGDLGDIWKKELKTDGFSSLGSLHFRWRTAVKVAVHARWEVLDKSSAVLKTGMLPTMPPPGEWRIFHVPFADVSLDLGPRVRVVLLAADWKTAVGAPSNSVRVMTGIAKVGAVASGAPALEFTQLEGQDEGGGSYWYKEILVVAAQKVRMRWKTAKPGATQFRYKVFDGANEDYLLGSAVLSLGTPIDGWYQFDHYFTQAVLDHSPGVRVVPLKANGDPLQASGVFRVKMFEPKSSPGGAPTGPVPTLPDAKVPGSRLATELEGSPNLGDLAPVWSKEVKTGPMEGLPFRWRTAAQGAVKARWEILVNKQVVKTGTLASVPPPGGWHQFKVSFAGVLFSEEARVRVIALSAADVPVPLGTSNVVRVLKWPPQNY